MSYWGLQRKAIAFNVFTKILRKIVSYVIIYFVKNGINRITGSKSIACYIIVLRVSFILKYL